MLGIGPIFLFMYPMWFGMSSAAQTIILDKHIIYFLAWVWFALSHTIFFMPFSVAWLILFFFSKSPYSEGMVSFYTFWLRDLISPTILYVILVTWLAFIGDAVAEWGTDDTAYKVIYPILIAIVYGLFAPFSILTVTGYNERAILYFDPVKE